MKPEGEDDPVVALAIAGRAEFREAIANVEIVVPRELVVGIITEQGEHHGWASCPPPVQLLTFTVDPGADRGLSASKQYYRPFECLNTSE